MASRTSCRSASAFLARFTSLPKYSAACARLPTASEARAAPRNARPDSVAVNGPKPPTVLLNVPGDSLVLNEEPFGPLAAVLGFDTLDEAIAEANRLPWGLAAYAFTGSLRTAQALTENVQAGMLWINQPALAWPEMPFGGVKDSGYGSEGGPEALEAYLNSKSVTTLCV